MQYFNLRGVVFWVFVLCLASSISLAADTMKAIVPVSAYNFPPPSSSVSKILHRFKQGDNVIVEGCMFGNCQVQCPNGAKGWVVEDALGPPNVDVVKAASAYRQAGFDHWDIVDWSVWSKFRCDMSKIDSCALKIAHGQAFNPETDWPAYCNTFRNTPQVLDRVTAIRDILLNLKLPEDSKNKIRAGQIWVGAPRDAAIAAWGTPVRVNKTVTKSGTSEQWVYGGHSFLYIEDGKVSAIQN